MTVSISDLISKAGQYSGEQVCTEGVAVSGFEVSAIAKGTVERSGATYLAEPIIWLENILLENPSDCFWAGQPPAEFCQVRVCGRFETGGGFGHQGGYDFQLSGDAAEVPVDLAVPRATDIEETAVPPLAIMTTPTSPLLLEATIEPGIWNGRATYASLDDENAPQFSLSYDPDIWQLLPPTGYQPAAYLSHRQQLGCTITSAVGMGLPDDWTVANSYEAVGNVGYELFRASQAGDLKFINYCKAVADSYTCFNVQLSSDIEECQSAAETVLGTMTTVPR